MAAQFDVSLMNPIASKAKTCSTPITILATTR